MKRKSFLFYCLTILFLSQLTLKGEDGLDLSKGKRSDYLVYAINTSPEGKFNPLIENTQYDEYVNKLVYASLLRLNSKLSLDASLAEKYKLSKDGKTLTFILRKGLTFHDGKALTTKDVKFTFEALAHPDYQGEFQSYVQSIKGYEEFSKGKVGEISGIVLKDERTIEINFSVPYAPALVNLGTLGILPEHIWKDVPKKEWTENMDVLSKPIGAGPYKLESFANGSYVRLVAFDKYYGGRPKTSNFVFKVVNEATVQAELLQGSVDIADVSSIKNKEAQLLSTQGVKVIHYPNSKVQYMGFNLRDERLDLNVRTAIAYGIDRNAIVNNLIEGNGVIIDTPMVPSLWSYPKKGLIHYTFDATKASECLKKAGYSDDDGDGFVEKDGQKLSLTLTVPKGDRIRELTGPIIQANLKKIGIEIVLEQMDFNATMQKVVGDHEFELYLMGNTLDADPDPTAYWYSTQATDEKGKFGWNIAAFRSQKADELMDKNRAETNQGKRKAILNEFGVLLNKELPWIPLYAADVVRAYRSSVRGYVPNTFVDFYNVEKWEVK